MTASSRKRVRLRRGRAAGLPDTALEREEEARPAISWPEESQNDRSVSHGSCRRARRWTIMLADLGVFLGGVAAVVPDEVRSAALENLMHLL